MAVGPVKKSPCFITRNTNAILVERSPQKAGVQPPVSPNLCINSCFDSKYGIGNKIVGSYSRAKQEWQSPFFAPANHQEVFHQLRSGAVFSFLFKPKVLEMTSRLSGSFPLPFRVIKNLRVQFSLQVIELVKYTMQNSLTVYNINHCR